MILLEIIYCTVALLGFFFLSGTLGRWASRNSINGPEWKVKVFSIIWRLSEVLLALIVLYILWEPMLRLGYNGGLSVEGGNIAFILAACFSLIFGTQYVLASLIVTVMVPFRGQAQREYLNETRAEEQEILRKAKK